MNVLVIGATGYIGSAVSNALKASGHTVLGTARSEPAAQDLRNSGVDPILADITDPLSITAAAQRSDAAIYVVQYTEPDGAQVERAALQALVDAFEGSGKVLLYTSGAWLYGDSGERLVDEQSPLNPTPLVAHRPGLERIVLDGAARNIRSMVVRPGDVYGDGGGLPAMWVKSAKDEGAARFVGDGNNHWPVVHVDDLAQLYVLMMTRGAAGDVYNASDDTSFTVREMATSASHGAGKGSAVLSWPLDEARTAMGAFADALALDIHMSSKKARDAFGWQPRTSTILDDLRFGSYTKEDTATGT
ncbi:MAG: NAD-dependent epimerase/dehydratase family protein [Candidatus Baltobacteraceae bacterium]